MGGGTLLFNPSHGIRFRAHPSTPFGPRTGHSSCCIYRRDSVQRCLAIKSEANKGAQSRQSSKSNSKLSSKSISETSTDEANSQREHLTSLLKKIEASIKKCTSLPEPKEKGMVEQKQQSLEPKSKEKEAIDGQMKSIGSPLNLDKSRRDDGNKSIAPQHDDIKSSGYESTFAILRRDDRKKVASPPRFDKLLRDNGKSAVAPPYFGKKKSSGPPSNFDKLIRDDSENAVSLPPDYKPPRPASRFVRRSPIPISDPVKEEANRIPKKNPPSAIVTEPLKKMSISDKLQAIIDKPRPPKPEPKWDLNEILKMKISPKFTSGGSGITNSEPELKLKLELEAATTSELRDIPQAEPKLEENSELGADSELEAMTLSELKDIAKARGLKGYSKLKKSKLLEILKGTPPQF